ncbi:PHA/PHB synthase family protein [Caldimonas thermodepolymerans]|jgi:Poly(3-hydroxyalkanoate) synthetase|uniref:PHA/PHB synthase family protein n=1 Tax=Caldimonas thermodepolymerans TaxID=215580 RepID=UPI00223671A5|nr:alpha/beta fold hydrolase [Caldimonas thermodepolymerans]UZG44454.1 alpha/beta fold hydrolase [Caldimonas thermodepolymerans]
MPDHDDRRSGSTFQPLDVPLKVALARMTHGLSPSALANAFSDWYWHLAMSPGKQLQLAESAWKQQLQWLLYVQAWGMGLCPPCQEPGPPDKRFAPPQWQRPPYHLLAQAFLLAQQWWREATTGVRGVSKHHEHVVEFVTRQWLDVWSPSNFVATNPQVQEETLRTLGYNLLRGGANWWRDALAVLTDGRPAGVERFRPGETVAVTPGQVVYRNRLIELIRYAPATDKVHPEPVLVVPSWIMKYYILDLSPGNSMVKYLVGRGHTVYMISWKNPGGEDRDLGMEDYLDLGVFAALDAITRAQPEVPLHGVGYCLGGTLMAIAAAALARDRKPLLKTLTLLAAQTDFEEPGELGLFIDESQIAFLEDLMAEQGYLDGRQMAGAFALINSKDLVWSKLVHEYLMGARTPLTDLRAWNADATRMPQRMHGEYLRRLYLDNDLAEGRYTVHGRPVALKDIRVPMFVVSTERDHVSPWPSVYKIHLLSDAEITFVLTSGGHNVGIVNPPDGPAASPQARYRIDVRAAGGPYVDAPTWQELAEAREGSWWPAWQAWLAARSGRPVKAPATGAGRWRALCEAPGTYVHMG